jgi:hypothetical protein
MSDILTILGISIATAVGLFTGVFSAAWTAIDKFDRRTISRLERALSRETAGHASDAALWHRDLARLRVQRKELLDLINKAWADNAQVRAEARAREEQIRRQVADSAFGALDPVPTASHASGDDKRSRR